MLVARVSLLPNGCKLQFCLTMFCLSSARLAKRLLRLAGAPVQVFLLTTKAGSLGINLTIARRMLILDEPWNPVHNAQVQECYSPDLPQIVQCCDPS